ncbi:MAG: hypothetical protein AMJ43_07665 [Coxiella sp. DG_40]|nr:MAG: hypothetical protein AMJ43_07665 [Coxiella sp. DG_40]
MKKSILLGSVIITLITTVSLQASLVSNGDFEAGNTGFLTDYIYIASPGYLHPDQRYTVHTDPHEVHSGFTSYGDHTSGAGNMLIVNAATAENQTVWQQTVSVTPNTDYVFTYWLSNCYPDAPANLQCSINGSAIGTGSAPSGESGVWYEVSHSWNSGVSTSAMIRLVDLTRVYSGDDFAIDDISLIPEPATLFLLGLGGLALLRKRRA